MDRKPPDPEAAPLIPEPAPVVPHLAFKARLLLVFTVLLIGGATLYLLWAL